MEIRQGIDIVSVRRIEQIIEKEGAAFTRRIFKPSERAYCEPRRRRHEHYAARFAAKEAFIKAVRGDRALGMELRDIEVRRHSGGKPYIHLTPAARKKLALPAGVSIDLSLSHEREYAVASVIIVYP